MVIWLKEWCLELVLAGLFISLIGFLMIKTLSVPDKVQKIIGQGEVSSVEYLQGNWESSTKTIVHFKAGGTTVLDHAAWSIPAGKIKILEPGHNNYYYEIVEEK